MLLQFTPKLCSSFKRLEDSVFSPDKRSTDAVTEAKKFTPKLCNNLKRLGDSVFSPVKRSTDAERASFAHGCANRSEKGLNTLASRRRIGQA